MLALKTEKYDVGAVVARFQVNTLHQAHKDLLDTVNQLHPTMIVLLGVGPLLASRHDPLTFEMRKQMIITDYPNAIILPIQDNQASNEAWSKQVDKLISSVTTHHQRVVLYGGRDSFKPYYSGRFPVLEFESSGFFSGTQVRQEVSVKTINSPDFRSGVIWARHNNFPICYGAVDVAIMTEDRKQLLLAKKPFQDKWQFVGGYKEPSSENDEQDVRRETSEETGVELSCVEYIDNVRIEDVRYEKEPDKIRTHFYIGTYMYGNAKAADDIEFVKWFDVDELFSMKDPPIRHQHMKLFEMLKNHLKGMKK